MKRARFYQDPDAPDAFADGGSMPRRRRDDGGGEGWQPARADHPTDSEDEEGGQPPAGARRHAPTARGPQPRAPPLARGAPPGWWAGETMSVATRRQPQAALPARYAWRVHPLK